MNRDDGTTSYKPVGVQELRFAELQIIKMAQNDGFGEAIRLLEDVNARLKTANRDVSKDKVKTTKK